MFSVLEFRLTYSGKGLAEPASTKDRYSWNTTAGREFRLAKLEAAMQNSWAARLIISTASASYRKVECTGAVDGASTGKAGHAEFLEGDRLLS